nr:ribosomal protein S18-alanine N-acetyltransferase [Haloarcula sp. R1-2]
MHELSALIDKQSEPGVSSVGGNTYVGPYRSTHVTTVAPDGPETPDTPAVRRAVRADLIEVHRIEQASFPQPWPFSALESYLGETGFLVAETGNDDDDPPAVAGYVIADTVPNHGTPLGHIKDLAVRPAYQRQGVASALLRRAMEVIDETGAGSVKLEVRADNGGARKLYRRFGFEHRKTIPNYYSNGEDALVMVRLL